VADTVDSTSALPSEFMDQFQ